MSATRVLTLAALRKAGACQSQLDLFRTAFGTRVVVTPARAVEHAQTFDWDWAARHLLSPTARTAYNAAVAPARAAYDAAVAQAWAAYRAAVAPAHAAYRAADAQASAAYRAAVAQAWAEAYIAD